MALTLAQVDAFTEHAFAGNPAAVCILDESVDDSWMQNLATEMNLSETAFLRKTADGFNLRWMTPVAEVNLCGHATLASAHLLWQLEHVDLSQDIHFFTKSGTLIAHKVGEWIELDFPAQPAKTIEQVEIQSLLEKALGVRIDYLGENEDYFLVETESEQTVRAISPDLAALRKLNGAVIVTARATTGSSKALSSSAENDFVSRMFAPGIGIDEDPVTGSAHCCLGPYWSKKLNKSEMVGYQCSKRGGIVRVRMAGDRVVLAGKATTIFVGQLAPSAMPAVVASK